MLHLNNIVALVSVDTVIAGAPIYEVIVFLGKDDVIATQPKMMSSPTVPVRTSSPCVPITVQRPGRLPVQRGLAHGIAEAGRDPVTPVSTGEKMDLKLLRAEVTLASSVSNTT